MVEVTWYELFFKCDLRIRTNIGVIGGAQLNAVVRAESVRSGDIQRTLTHCCLKQPNLDPQSPFGLVIDILAALIEPEAGGLQYVV